MKDLCSKANVTELLNDKNLDIAYATETIVDWHKEDKQKLMLCVMQAIIEQLNRMK